MYARIATAILLFTIIGSAAQAAGGKTTHPAKSQAKMGTDAEQEACTPDATKFCDDKIPDTLAVLGCLQEHRKRLSKACQHVLEANGQ